MCGQRALTAPPERLARPTPTSAADEVREQLVAAAVERIVAAE
ncbi:hypothetical protein [Streptomyces malaysiensis]|nr:hypothetical protein [Streptomyces sp. DR7-3]